jgi:hypothetical protein
MRIKIGEIQFSVLNENQILHRCFSTYGFVMACFSIVLIPAGIQSVVQLFYTKYEMSIILMFFFMAIVFFLSFFWFFSISYG